jgi:ATP-dependent Clp protease ATP-binding subunit ClpB/ATP-dependent Clp protease ATP-binding subunit ClpC
MTTNAGSDNSAMTVGFASDTKKSSENKTMKALSSFLRPEFINRVDEIITFNSLSEDNFADIARIMLDELKVSLSEKNIKFGYSEEAARLIAKESYSHKFGARNMRRYIRSHVEDALAEKIISDYKSEISIASLSVNDENKLFVECI